MSLSGNTMIIPDSASPSYTNRDNTDAYRYCEQRARLWLINYCVAKWPQVFSWTTVNVYPASPVYDYRFDADFADSAIMVTVEWDKSGKGCRNSTCYPTFPKGRTCTINDGPVRFPSGENTTVYACQPACYMKRRHEDIYRNVPADRALVDQKDPKACGECALLTRNVFGRNYVRRVDGSYWQYDAVDQKTYQSVPEPGKAATMNKQEEIDLDVDMKYVAWNAKANGCVLANEMTYRMVTEPYWRDPSHSKCRLTNFVHGDDVVWGYEPKHVGQSDPQGYGFLVKHSKTYCRAFLKEFIAETGDCEQSLLNKILSYTIAGDMMLRWVKRINDGDWGCAEDKWRPIAGERSTEIPVEELTSQNDYRTWRADINLDFRLPPPNALLSDLGIHVRSTGNRLYWNSVEGVLSNFPLFNSVETLMGGGSDGNSEVVINRDFLSLYSLYNGNYANSNVTGNVPRSSQRRKRRDIVAEATELRDLLFQKRENVMRRLKRANVIDQFDTLARADKQRLGWKILTAEGDLDERKLDETIAAKFSELKDNELFGRAVRSGNDEFLTSTTASVPFQYMTHEYVGEQYLRSYEVDDSLSESTSSSSVRNKRSTTNSDINDMVDHINDINGRDAFLDTIKEVGIGVGEGVLEDLLGKVLKRGSKKVIQLVSKYLASGSTKILLKVGFKIGMARIIGVAVTRVTTRVMVALVQIGSVVGAVIGLIQLLAAAFDLAEMAGWDPGEYGNEHSLVIYRDAADFFNYALEDAGRGPIPPLELMNTLILPNKSLDGENDKASEQGTANTTQTTETSKVNVDYRVDLIKWFNAGWEECYKRDDRRLTIQDNLDGTTFVTAFQYLGSLKTNSFGQRLVDEAKFELDDQLLQETLTEADYRSLTSVSATTNIENADFNDRTRTSGRVNGILLYVSGASAALSTLLVGANFYMQYRYEGEKTPRTQKIASIISGMTTILLVVAVFAMLVYMCVALIPVKSQRPRETADESAPKTTDTTTLGNLVETLRKLGRSI